MRLPGSFRRTFRNLYRRPAVERSVAEEMAFHLEESTHRIMEQEGLGEAAARAEAVRRFGSVNAYGQELVDRADRQRRSRERESFFRAWWYDVRLAARGIWHHPGFALLSVLILAVGIGITTSVFSVVDGIVLRPLPYPAPDRLVALHTTSPEGAPDNWSGPDYLDLAASSESYVSLAALRAAPLSIGEGDYPVMHAGGSVTEDFFRVLGVRPVLGEAVLPRATAERSVVLSWGLWRSAFGADEGIVGQAITLSGASYTVRGVMPKGFAYPEGAELWIDSRYRVPEPPFDFGQNPEVLRGAEYFDVIARLRPAISIEKAGEETRGISARLAEESPGTNAGESMAVTGLRDELVGPVRFGLLVLLGAVGFVLLIACANVASLLLVRAFGRHREMAVRRVLGADPLRLVRLLMVESVLLGLSGGLLGLLLSIAGTRALLLFVASDLPRVGEVGMDPGVLMFALGVSLASSFLFGLAPLTRLRGSDLSSTLREGDGRQSQGRTALRLRKALVIAETAICLVLLVGAGLTIRTMALLGDRDPGFSGNQVLTARLILPAGEYDEDARVIGFYGDVESGIEHLPGVADAAFALSPPMAGGIQATMSLQIEGRTYEPEEQPTSGYQSVTPDYFSTLRIPLLEGRMFTQQDREGSEPVAIVSRALADRYFPDGDAVGSHIAWGGDPGDEDFQWDRIVGVVGNTLHNGLLEGPRVEGYEPFAQSPWPFMNLVARVDGDPERLVPDLRRVVAGVDARFPLDRIRTMQEVVAGSVSRQQANMILMGLFAGIALLLALVGLYGVTSYSVAQRTREIGIRMALGAGSREVVRGVLREAARTALFGLSVGLVLSLALTRLATSLVFGISPQDPVAMGAASLLLLGASLLAAWIPARRAARVDPSSSLREA